MLQRIEKGEAQGIICWKLDRLARNPVDGGQISWFSKRASFSTSRPMTGVYRSADNVLMMSVEFGMANQFIMDLSANMKRGLHEKVKRGEYPSFAPVGYMNDLRTKTIVVDRKNAKIVREAFELYAEGNSRLEDIAAFFAKNGIVSGNGRPLKRDRISYMLSNPFYYGHFRYAGEIYEGKHTPLISKKLFDRVQAVLKERGRPQYKMENDPRPLCGLFKCGECGCGITAEKKTKHQKNGNVHHYTLLSLHKEERPLLATLRPRGEVLAAKLSETLKPFALPSDWAAELSKLADKDEKEAVQSSATASQAMRDEITAISQKLQRLLTAYLDQDIEREAYRSEKAEPSLPQEVVGGENRRTRTRDNRLARTPAGLDKRCGKCGRKRGFTLALYAKKSSAQKIFGSNLFLKNRLLVSTPTPPYASLREARLNFLENPLSLNLVGRPE